MKNLKTELKKILSSFTRPQEYKEYLATRIEGKVGLLERQKTQYKLQDVVNYVISREVPVYQTDGLLAPFSMTKILQEKLGYEMTSLDVLWSNYVHLVVESFIQNPEVRKRPFGGVIIGAINYLIETQGMKNKQAYKLWIDAGIITKEIEPVDQTPFAQITK